MRRQDEKQLMLFPADSRASRSVLPGSAEARKMTVTSGLKCLELYRNSSPLGSLVRMLLGSSVWHSTRCYLTWKVSATPAKRLLFRLAPSVLHTDETEYASWAGNEHRAIYFIPTPRTVNAPTSEKAKVKYKASPGLADYVKLFPMKKARKNRENGKRLGVEVRGQLNPTWVEWLMGFQIGWTDLNASETL